MKNFTISMIGKGLITNILADKYDVLEEDGYLHAIIRSEEDKSDIPEELMIHVVSRKLRMDESTIVHIAANAVEKLEYKAKFKAAGDITPCVAFCVCKRSYDDAEVLIASLDEIRTNARTGGVFAASGRGLFYDYAKCSDTKPKGALFKAKFKRIMED